MKPYGEKILMKPRKREVKAAPSENFAPVGERAFEFDPDADILFPSEIVPQRCDLCGDPAECFGDFGKRCQSCCPREAEHKTA